MKNAMTTGFTQMLHGYINGLRHVAGLSVCHYYCDDPRRTECWQSFTPLAIP